MDRNIARENHFVPRALLDNWRWSDRELRGYKWDPQAGKLYERKAGPKGFGFKIDLLTTKSKEGDRDKLETSLFQQIDNIGAAACRELVSSGMSQFNTEKRRQFAKWLMSVEARRPETVDLVRRRSLALEELIDADVSLRESLNSFGVSSRASEVWEQSDSEGMLTERCFEEVIKELTGHTPVLDALSGARWSVFCLGENDGTLLLSDRPLFRTGDVFEPDGSWFWSMPLTPGHLFVAAGHEAIILAMRKVTARRLRKLANTTSAYSAESYVFAIDGSHMHWLPACFKKKSAS